MLEAEVKYITWCRTLGCNLTNLTRGGNCGKPTSHTKETKEKLRLLNLGPKNPMYGKVPSQESRNAQSKRMKGKVPSYFSDPEKIRNAIAKTLAKRRSYSGAANPNWVNRGSKSKLAKVLLQLNQAGQIVGRYVGLKEAARTLGFNERGIRKVITGDRKTYKGYFWRYE